MMLVKQNDLLRLIS